MSNREVSYKYSNIINCEFYGNDESEYYFIPILKNGHLWALDFFEELANFKLVDNFADKKFIVFLRDPKERWLSGTAQWFTNNYKVENLELTDLNLKLIFAAEKLDNHSASQFKTIDGLLQTKYNKFTFFKMDERNFYSSLTKFVNDKMNYSLPSFNEPRNVSSENKFQFNIRNQLIDALETNKFFNEQLEEHLKKDYEQMSMHRKLFYNLDNGTN